MDKIYLLQQRIVDLYGEDKDSIRIIGYTPDRGLAGRWKTSSPGYTEHREIIEVAETHSPNKVRRI